MNMTSKPLIVAEAVGSVFYLPLERAVIHLQPSMVSPFLSIAR
jgi:hypothetical protein